MSSHSGTRRLAIRMRINEFVGLRAGKKQNGAGIGHAMCSAGRNDGKKAAKEEKMG